LLQVVTAFHQLQEGGKISGYELIKTIGSLDICCFYQKSTPEAVFSVTPGTNLSLAVVEVKRTIIEKLVYS